MADQVVADFLVEHRRVLIGIGAAGLAYIVFRQWRSGGQCGSAERLDGKTVIITGANTGIGKETARNLAKRGAKVIMACRDCEKAVEAACEIGNPCKANVHGPISVRHLDLASFDSIRRFTDEILQSKERVDILINNAGIFCSKQMTEDGYDCQFQTNHLGPFLLTNLLLDRIKESAPSRIINVSSKAHYRAEMDWDDLNKENSPYDAFRAYGQSKLANILFTRELARKLEGSGVTTYAAHPGLVSTEFLRFLPSCANKLQFGLITLIFSVFAKTPVQGAQTTIHCAVSSKLATQSGMFYSDCRKKKPSKRSLNKEDASRLWDISAEMVGLKADCKYVKKNYS